MPNAGDTAPSLSCLQESHIPITASAQAPLTLRHSTALRPTKPLDDTPEGTARMQGLLIPAAMTLDAGEHAGEISRAKEVVESWRKNGSGVCCVAAAKDERQQGAHFRGEALNPRTRWPHLLPDL